MIRFPNQLSECAVDKTYSNLPKDVYHIGEGDLGHLGYKDLLIAGWPCQGHSQVGVEQSLDDPQSNIFMELMGIMH